MVAQPARNSSQISYKLDTCLNRCMCYIYVEFLHYISVIPNDVSELHTKRQMVVDYVYIVTLTSKEHESNY